MSDLIKVHVKDRNGVLHSLEAPTDMNLNVMELCRSYELEVEGTCGGMALCATCQCYILSNHELPEKSDDEEAMLYEAFNVKENSRLGCQLVLTPEIDGLEIEIAPDDF